MGRGTGEEQRRAAFHGLVGASAGMQEVYRRIELFGPAETPVVITGETGTGKTLAARALHEVAGSDRTFVEVNCAALTDDLVRTELFGHTKGAFTGAVRDREGLLARADGGILFLDEIAELPPDVQSMLLKALEQGRFRPVGSDRPVTSDFRLVAATHGVLEETMEEGDFRSDLLHRLGVARIDLPPLREREGDIELLAREFLRRHDENGGSVPGELAPEAVAALEAYRWPGNVRQLEQVVDAAAVLARGEPRVGADHVLAFLPAGNGAGRDASAAPLDLDRARRRTERKVIRRALERTGGHRERAAELLGIGVSTLYRKLPLEGE